MWNRAPPTSVPAASATNGCTTWLNNRSGRTRVRLPDRARADIATPATTIQVSVDTEPSSSSTGRTRPASGGRAVHPPRTPGGDKRGGQEQLSDIAAVVHDLRSVADLWDRRVDLDPYAGIHELRQDGMGGDGDAEIGQPGTYRWPGGR